MSRWIVREGARERFATGQRRRRSVPGRLGLVTTLRFRHFSQNEAVSGAERFFECLWCAQTTLAMFAHAGAQSFFFRASKHTRLRRASATATLCCCRHVAAWPFQQGASHRCAGLPPIENFTIEIFEARSHSCFQPPLFPTPVTNTKFVERVDAELLEACSDLYSGRRRCTTGCSGDL